MFEKRKVVKKSNLPTGRPPILTTVVTILALDYWQAPGWLFGIFGTVLVLLWMTWIQLKLTQEEVDILKIKSKNHE